MADDLWHRSVRDIAEGIRRPQFSCGTPTTNGLAAFANVIPRTTHPRRGIHGSTPHGGLDVGEG